MDLDEIENIKITKNETIDEKIVDIYIKQRNGKKCITTIQGLGNEINLLKSYSKDLRKTIACSCSIDSDETSGNYFLKMSGKDTEKICKYLIDNLKIKKENIKIHGE